MSVTVAVFARGLTKEPTGRGSYARQMIERLARHAPDLRLTVFAGEALIIPGCEVRPARGTNPVSDAWRVLRGVARDAAAHDVFWSTTHFLPSGLPRRQPATVTLHDLVWKDHPETMAWSNRLAAGWLEGGLRRATRIVCVSEWTRDRLRAHWPELASRAVVIHEAPNPRLRSAPETPLAELGIAGPFVLTVGTIEPRKNLAQLLAAMRELPPLQLVHCGPVGWRAEGILAQARGMANVRLLGYRHEAIVATLYRRAVAAVFPSRYEGFHLPPLDAASVGCPVLASDIPVHHEVLGDAASYFALDDPGALAERIRQVAAWGPDDRGRRSERLERRAAAFSWDRAAEQMADVLRSAGRSAV